MTRRDAAVVAQMARELAAVLQDPEPALDPNDLVRDGIGPERWFDCLVAARLAIGQQGCEAVYWDLWRLNRVGKAFYESLGAVEIGDLAIWHVGSRQLAAAGDE